MWGRSQACRCDESLTPRGGGDTDIRQTWTSAPRSFQKPKPPVGRPAPNPQGSLRGFQVRGTTGHDTTRKAAQANLHTARE